MQILMAHLLDQLKKRIAAKIANLKMLNQMTPSALIKVFHLADVSLKPNLKNLKR